MVKSHDIVQWKTKYLSIERMSQKWDFPQGSSTESHTPPVQKETRVKTSVLRDVHYGLCLYQTLTGRCSSDISSGGSRRSPWSSWFPVPPNSPAAVWGRWSDAAGKQRFIVLNVEEYLKVTIKSNTIHFWVTSLKKKTLNTMWRKFFLGIHFTYNATLFT